MGTGLVGKKVILRRVSSASGHVDREDVLTGLIGTITGTGSFCAKSWEEKRYTHINPYVLPDEMCARTLGCWEYLTRDAPHSSSELYVSASGERVASVSILGDYEVLDEPEKGE